ncbi:MAG: hypothetical protein P8K64_00165 [Acidimicrobiales bacterium]|nr:hypothetical protein [Acidimicrobiales bacterium]
MSDQSAGSSSFILVYSSEEDSGILSALEVISKLSEAGQTKEIIWVNPSEKNTSNNPQTNAFRIQAGIKYPIDLYAEIASAGALRRVDLFTTCSFWASPNSQEYLGARVRELITYLQGLVPGNTTVNDKRIFFPKFGSLKPDGNFFPSVGSTNLIVIPEDREFPSSVAFPFDSLGSLDLNNRFSWHMASELLSLTGLWITMQDHLLADSKITTGGNVTAQLSRSFVRSAVSTTETPDNLLDLENNLPTPKGHDLTPNYLHAIRSVADDAYPEVFATEDLEPFDPITRVAGWKIIFHVLRRVFKDLGELPTTLKNGFQSQLDRIVTQTAAELVGEYSWVRPLWEETDSTTSTADTNPLDIENLLADLNAGTELNSPSVDPEAWNRMLNRTLASVDGSPENYFDGNKTVIVKRSALTPETVENELPSVLLALGVEPQELDPENKSASQDPENNEPESALPQENLLSLIINKFDSERQRIYNRIETCLDRLKNIEKPTSQDRSETSRYIRWFFIGSIIVAFLAITTLIDEVRESLDFGHAADLRTILFLVASALISIPLILLFAPNDKKKTGTYLISSFTGLSVLTTVLLIFHSTVGSIGSSGGIINSIIETLTAWGAAGISLLVVAFLCRALWKRRKRSESNSLAKLGKRILYIMGPTYLIVIYIFTFARGTKAVNDIAGRVDWIISHDNTLLTISLVAAGVAFLTSAFMLSIYKMQDENYLNIYREESTWLINSIEDASKHYREISMLRIHWLGTSVVLHRLLNHPFGDLQHLELRTAFRPIGSDELLKTKTLDLNLTEDGKTAFLNEAIPNLTPPGWITQQYRRVSKAFIEDSDSNFAGKIPPELCSFPFSVIEQATDAKEIQGKGTRWPFAHRFFGSGPLSLDSVLRDSANESLTDTLLATYMEVDDSWIAEDGSGNTLRLQELFSQIAPRPENPAHFSMGMFGTAAGLFTASSEMSPLFVWPEEEIVTLPSGSLEPTAKAPHQRVGNSIIFQAVRVDVSDPINLDEMRSLPGTRDGDAGNDDDEGADGSALFGGN